MAQVIANELERFRQDIRSVEQKIQTLETTYHNMFDEIHSLTGMWEGGAHDAYIAQFESDSENMRLTIKNLKEFKKSMDEAYRSFQTCEHQVEEVVRQVRI